MIKVDRSSISIPPQLAEKAKIATDKLHAFLYKQDYSARIQRQVKYDASLWKRFKLHMFDMFHGKCAYCESTISDGQTGDVDMFRPKRGALNLDTKQKSPDHYWWLTYEWENLYLACRTCNVRKGSKFPVDGERGNHPQTVKELRETENYLLIDPCYDEPDEHFVFGDDGMIAPRTDRGRVTIETLDLNRTDLVMRRLDELSSLYTSLADIFDAGELSEDLLKRETDPSRRYSAARRHAAQRFLLETGEAIKPSVKKLVKKLVKEIRESPTYVSKEEVEALKEEFVAAQVAREQESVTSEQGTESLFIKSQHISRIVIRNFRNIEDLDIVFPTPQDGLKPWVVLLGENGMGKSSILKAVALTLMPDETRNSLDITSPDILRRGTTEGFVEVYVVPYQTPFRLDFNIESETITSNKNVLHTLLFCYGGTRLLPNKFVPADTATDDYSRVINLFNPFLPLIDAENWLLQLPDDKFGYSAKAIKQLINADDERLLVRIPDECPAEVRLNSSFLKTSDSLQTLSDGYQSVIALVTDILEIMLKHYDEVEDSEGIVLIDEIDVHLHPRWKIEIVRMLRSVFPRVQFILSTHDPLCLLGNRPGEVHVLRRGVESSLIEIKQVDVPPGTTADQVLTGFWFGLRSTLDDETLALVDQHRKMLRDKKPEDDPLRIKLEEDLRSRLGTFADTSIDRMAQSVASEIIRDKVGNVTIEEREKMRNNIRSRMKELIKQGEEQTDAEV